MLRLLIAAFIACHGLVHGIMFALPYSAQARVDLPFNPSRSWLIGDSRRLGLAIALAVSAAFVVAAGAYLARNGWWQEATMLAAAFSIGLLTLYASSWWIAGYVISVALLVIAWRARTSG